MSDDFFDPTTAEGFPETPEGLKMIHLHCTDIRSRIKVYESLENEYAFWCHHLLFYTKREYWEDIFKNEGIEGWAEKMTKHILWVVNNEYIFNI